MIRDALGAGVVWVTVARPAGGGPGRRDYRVLSADGDVLLEMSAHPWRREMLVLEASSKPVILLRRRRSFPLSGKVDVFELPARRRLGIISRSGRIRGRDGRTAGRLRDARTLGARTREGAWIALLETMFGGDGGSVPSGRDGFVYVVGDTPIGALGRGRPPFDEGNTVRASRPSGLRRLLPGRLGEPWPTRAGHAWKLERAAEDSNDPLLVMAAALFAIELSHW